MSQALTSNVPFRKTAAGRLVRDVRQKFRRLQRELYQRLMCRDSQKRILIILGCQRSGTTMLGNLFSSDLRAAVLQERNSATVADTLRLRPLQEVNDILQGLRASLVVIKPIVESQWAPELLHNIEHSRVIWMYRNYRKVVQSNVARFHSQIEGLRMAVTNSPPSWRSERLSGETQELQKRFYDSQMSREDAAAVGWYARNSLFFELGLEKRSDVRLLKYEQLVRHPEATITELYRFLEIPSSSRPIWREVDSNSLSDCRDLQIRPELSAACDQLLSRLDETNRLQASSQLAEAI